MRHKGRPLHRRRARLEPKPRILVICEGEATEPSYFQGLKREEQLRPLEIEVDGRGEDPKTLVERAALRMKQAKKAARAARDENLSYDEVWCVFDVDTHRKLADAKQQANANGISIAVSNPCFELWLLLHFKEQNASIKSSKIQSAYRRCDKKFDKRVNFELLGDKVDDAIQRADKLDKWQISRGCAGHNPSTTVYKLVLRMKELSKASALGRIRQIQDDAD